MSDKKNDKEILETLSVLSRTPDSSTSSTNSMSEMKTSKPQLPTPEARARVLAAFKRVLEKRKQRQLNQERVLNAELQMTPLASDWIM